MMKYITARRITYTTYIILLLTVILCILQRDSLTTENTKASSDTIYLTKWETADTGKSDFAPPLRFSLELENDGLSASTVLPEKTSQRSCVMFFCDAPSLTVSLDGVLIYRFDGEQASGSTEKWHIVNLPERFMGKTFSLSFDGTGDFLLSAVYLEPVFKNV